MITAEGRIENRELRIKNEKTADSPARTEVHSGGLRESAVLFKYLLELTTSTQDSSTLNYETP
ncbi:MAG: hypothetical protein A3B08_02740 [Candidatus Taylorbacteria bacterium RIFCSPLOWO2_01_FULL_43_44]|nr:MAG: hypothetical protein A3B08_02740 [Candidatus Taylorbacteria bacterium RIFCSPLOWO2_01_FULL_43_44]